MSSDCINQSINTLITGSNPNGYAEVTPESSRATTPITQVKSDSTNVKMPDYSTPPPESGCLTLSSPGILSPKPINFNSFATISPPTVSVVRRPINKENSSDESQDELSNLKSSSSTLSNLSPKSGKIRRGSKKSIEIVDGLMDYIKYCISELEDFNENDISQFYLNEECDKDRVESEESAFVEDNQSLLEDISNMIEEISASHTLKKTSSSEVENISLSLSDDISERGSSIYDMSYTGSSFIIPSIGSIDPNKSFMESSKSSSKSSPLESSIIYKLNNIGFTNSPNSSISELTKQIHLSKDILGGDSDTIAASSTQNSKASFDIEHKTADSPILKNFTNSISKSKLQNDIIADISSVDSVSVLESDISQKTTESKQRPVLPKIHTDSLGSGISFNGYKFTSTPTIPVKTSAPVKMLNNKALGDIEMHKPSTATVDISDISDEKKDCIIESIPSLKDKNIVKYNAIIQSRKNEALKLLSLDSLKVSGIKCASYAVKYCNANNSSSKGSPMSERRHEIKKKYSMEGKYRYLVFSGNRIYQFKTACGRENASSPVDSSIPLSDIDINANTKVRFFNNPLFGMYTIEIQSSVDLMENGLIPEDGFTSVPHAWILEFSDVKTMKTWIDEIENTVEYRKANYQENYNRVSRISGFTTPVSADSFASDNIISNHMRCKSASKETAFETLYEGQELKSSKMTISPPILPRTLRARAFSNNELGRRPDVIKSCRPRKSSLSIQQNGFKNQVEIVEPGNRIRRTSSPAMFAVYGETNYREIDDIADAYHTNIPTNTSLYIDSTKSEWVKSEGSRSALSSAKQFAKDIFFGSKK